MPTGQPTLGRLNSAVRCLSIRAHYNGSEPDLQAAYAEHHPARGEQGGGKNSSRPRQGHPFRATGKVAKNRPALRFRPCPDHGSFVPGTK